MKTKSILSLALSLLMMLSMAACNHAGSEPPETTAAPIKTDVANPLSMDDIDAIPIANDSMTEEQLRQICVDFARLQLTYGWTVSEEVTYSNGRAEKTFYPDKVYGGIPYISNSVGNIYTAARYVNLVNGVIDVSDGPDVFKIFANQCSGSLFWAWARVCNSFHFAGTSDTLDKTGCLPLGDYTYSDTLTDYREYSTVNICMDNGPETMYKAYAMLKPGDGIVNYTTAGHMCMVSKEPNIVYREDGVTIDPNRSTITYLDQMMGWNEQIQSNGIPYEIEGSLDCTISFAFMFNQGYLPFTIAELNKNDPVEKGEVKLDCADTSVSVSKLSGCNLTSNYAISDITLTVKDKDGKEAYSYTHNVYPAGLDKCYDPTFLEDVVNSEALAPYTNGKYTVEISARIGTGEKLVAYTATLVS